MTARDTPPVTAPVTAPVTPSPYTQGRRRGVVGPARAREAVRRAIRSAAIRVPDVFAPGTRLVVGFSGGQDSTCMLHALAHSHRKLDLLAVHVDHGLRPDSAKSAEAAVSLAQTMGVPAKVIRVDAAAQKLQSRTSVQVAARAVRYRALADAAEQHHAAAVLVAHTADDQAETVLLNLLRGTGLLGLAAMRLDERRHDGALRLVRPLLVVPRSTTFAYCGHFELHFVEDASNQSPAYTRNRVRLDVLPLLEQFNPDVRAVIARMADIAAEENAALEVLAADLHARIARDQGYDLRLFRAQPRALQRRMLRFALEVTVGELIDVAAAPIEDALELIQTGQPNQTYHLPYGVELCMRSETFVLRAEGRARRRQEHKNWEKGVSRV